ncbi:MAG: FHA domain-containing protein, partial [Myxococcota bacterium]
MGQDPETTTLRVRSGPRRAARTRQNAPLQQTALLVALVGPDAGKRVVVGDGVIIGRDVDGRGLIIDEGVSRRHMRVSRQADGSHLVEDLGSRNGTYVNGQRIEAAPLRGGLPRCFLRGSRRAARATAYAQGRSLRVLAHHVPKASRRPGKGSTIGR